MNKRIKKLAEQAGSFVDLNQHVGGEKGCMVYTYDGLEKFAELIVQECADLCLKYAKHEGPFNTMEFRKGQHFNTIIKDHFGVDE